MHAVSSRDEADIDAVVDEDAAAAASCHRQTLTHEREMFTCLQARFTNLHDRDTAFDRTANLVEHQPLPLRQRRAELRHEAPPISD